MYRRKATDSTKAVLIFLLLIPICAGCAGDKVYVDTDEVPGLGVEVRFPSGKIVPIGVRQVISGDTIELTNGETVSYIGVYIPQLSNIPDACKALNEKLVLEDQIRLEFDKRQRDSKGRLLAYVYKLDGTFVNEEIIRQGLARVLVRPPNTKYKELLLEAEDDARKRKIGIWSVGPENKEGFIK